MKVLMISKDRSVLDEGSNAHKRLRDYASLFEELHVVILAKSDKNKFNTGNLFITGYGKKISVAIFFSCFFDILKISKKFKKEDWISTQDPFEAGFIGLIISKIRKIKFQAQIHTDCFDPMFRQSSIKNLLRFMLSKIVLMFADSIRVVSEKIKISIIDSHQKIKSEIHVLPVFVDFNKLSMDTDSSIPESLKKFNKKVLVVSRLEKEKNVSLALESMRRISRQIPNCGMVVIGDGSEKKWLVKLVKRLGIEDKVIFEGFVKNPGVYFKNADMLLVTSFFEGFGMAMVEASYFGCPIVSTDVGIARDVGANITSFDPGNISIVSAQVLEKNEKIPKRFFQIERSAYLSKFKDTFKV